MHVTHQKPTKKARFSPSLLVVSWASASINDKSPAVGCGFTKSLKCLGSPPGWAKSYPDLQGCPFRCGCCLLCDGHFNIVVHGTTHSPKLGTYDWLLSDSWNSIHSSEPHRLLVDNYTWPPSRVTITMPRFFGALNRRLKTSVNQKSYTPENEHGT